LPLTDFAHGHATVHSFRPVFSEGFLSVEMALSSPSPPLHKQEACLRREEEEEEEAEEEEEEGCVFQALSRPRPAESPVT
jgi:hypothetical protein